MTKAEYEKENKRIQESLAEIGVVKSGLYEKKTDDERRQYLAESSSCSKFEDNAWLIDLKDDDMNIEKSERTLSFKRIADKPILCRDVKDWVLDQLVDDRKVKGLNSALRELCHTLVLIEGDKHLKDVTKTDIIKIYDTLCAKDCASSTRKAYWDKLRVLFESQDFVRPASYMAALIMPKAEKHKCKDKYIDKETAKKMDAIFYREDIIPLTFRCIYWTLRLFPNRIEEVISIPLDNMKPLTEGHYLFTILVNKTSGNFDTPEDRHFDILDEGMGHFFIDLIQRQIEFTKSNMPESKFMFVSRKVEYRMDTTIGERRYQEVGEKLYIVSEKTCLRFFSYFCKRFDIHDEDGNIASVTTHKLRHNCITDRIRSKIFRDIDVSFETGHKSLAMIRKNYYHNEPAPRDITFKGKVADMDSGRVAMLKASPYASQLFGLGLCRNISGCNGSRAACLRCEFLTPDPKNLDVFEHNRDEWQAKYEKALDIGNDAFAEQCADWVDAYNNAIRRIGDLVEEDNHVL